MRPSNKVNSEFEFISQRLREAISDSHISQKQIAKNVFVSQSAISSYMHGTSLPALDTLARLCAYLDVSADYILDLKEY